MKSPKSLVLLFAAMLGGMTSATAGVTGSVTTAVTTLQPVDASTGKPTATYSRTSLISYVGYVVTISNTGKTTSNTANSVTFTATTAVLPTVGTPPYQATFAGADGATCGLVGGTSISCPIGTLRIGQSKTFAVYFAAPINSNNIAANQEAVRLTGVTNYSEGTKDTSSKPNDSSLWSVGDVVLGTPDPTNFKSALPMSGGTFSTEPTDQFATFVNVPQTTQPSTIQINEMPLTGLDPVLAGDALCISLNHFNKCYESAITIPNIDFLGTGNYLTIKLRVDASNIKSSADPAGAKIYYQRDLSSPSYLVYPDIPCVNNLPRADGVPCWASFGSSAIGVGVEWIFLNLRNGSYRVF